MDEGFLGKKIIALFKAGEAKTLALLLQKALADFRPRVLADLAELMPGVDGKLRMKLLELLMEDGRADLIPLFIRTISMEKNVLYAKSMLLIYGNFEHQQAIPALSAIEKDLSSDLKSTYQRVASRLKARFRESFYMDEFDSPVFKKMRFAANVMIKEPHPSYLPFLHDRVDSQRPEIQNESMRVLLEIGDESSIEVLFLLAEDIMARRVGAAALDRLLAGVINDRTRHEPLLREFAGAIGVGAVVITDLFHEAADGRLDLYLKTVLDGCHLEQETVREQTTRFLKVMAGGHPISAGDGRRFKEAVADYRKQLEVLLATCLDTLGGIAARRPVPGLIGRVDKMIPLKELGREGLLVRVMAGAADEEARTMYLKILKAGKHPDLMVKVLNGLAACEPAECPDSVLELAVGDKGDQRLAAIRLAGKWGRAHELLRGVLSRTDTDMLRETLQMIREQAPPATHAVLLELPGRRLPPELKAEAILALAAFPGEQTVAALSPMLQPAVPYGVRSAAVTGLLRCGVPGFSALATTLQGLPGEKRPELEDSLLKQMAEEPVQVWQDGLYGQPAVMMQILVSSNHKNREKLLSLLEQPTWDLEDYEPWLKAAGAVGDLSGLEAKRFAKWLETVEARAEAARRYGRYHKTLQQILDSFQQEEDKGHVQAMRKLSMAFKAEMVADNPRGLEQLVESVGNFLDSHRNSDDLVRLFLTVAAKIGAPCLMERAEKLITHANPDIAAAARELVLQQVGRHEGDIQSIFILDDSRYMTKQLSSVLVKAGFKVAAENSVRDGLMMLSRDNFDLMILDLEMPEMDGLQFLATVRNANLAPEHILVISSSRDREELSRVIAAGVEGLFLKPFPMNELISKIEELEAA